MEALRAYNSNSSNDDSDAEPAAKVVCKPPFISSGERGLCETEVPMERKQAPGYISKRKAREGSHMMQSESSRTESSVLLRSMRDSSMYCFSSPCKKPTEREHARQCCVVPKRIPYSTFTQHTKPVLGLCWHPLDDRLLLSCSLDGTVRLWDVLWQKECLAIYAMQGIPMKRISWTTNNTMVCAGYDNCAFYTDVESGRVLSKLKHNGHVTALAVHPEDCNSLLTGDSKSELQRWDLRCSKKVTRYKGAGGSILDILFLKSGDQFVASSDIEKRSSYNQSLNVWDYGSGVVWASQLYFEPYNCPVLKLHPVDSVFLAQSNANYLTVFLSEKPYKMNKFKRFEGHSFGGYTVGFDVSNDGSIICSASADGTTVFYDYFSTRILKSIPLSTSSTLDVEWHPKLPSTVAVSCWNGHIFCLK